MDPRLGQVVERLSVGTGRVCFLLDREYRLVWVSPELRGFLGVGDDAPLGIGRHIVALGLEPAWREAVTPESRLRLAREIVLPWLGTEGLPSDAREALPQGPAPSTTCSRGFRRSRSILSPRACATRPGSSSEPWS